MAKTDSQAAQELGRVLLQRYRLDRLLASGASGTVFEGRDLRRRRRVAVKILHRDHLRSRQLLKRFIREVRAAAKIQHPGVVAFLDVGTTDDNRPFIVQEFLHGQDMLTLLASRALSLPEIFEIGVLLLDALEAVHQAGLVHRDVKPENVFVVHGQHGEIKIKLVDFGVVKQAADSSGSEVSMLTEVGVTVGTPNYMSPEQARAEELDRRADIWSVGMVLFYALTGELPFDAPTPIEVLVRIVSEQPPRLAGARPDLPVWLTSIVDKALQRHPDLRWQTASEMALALKAATANAKRRP